MEFRNDTQLYTGNIEKYTVGLAAFVHFGGNFLSYANEKKPKNSTIVVQDYYAALSKKEKSELMIF